MTTISESISRVRGIMKGTKEDAFLTDRFVYSIISKYTKVLLKRQQTQSKLMGHDDLFEMLSFVNLIDVNKIEAECAPIKTNCTIKRTEIKLPKLGESIVSATVVQWFKKEGDLVKLDEPLLEVSTDNN